VIENQELPVHPRLTFIALALIPVLISACSGTADSPSRNAQHDGDERAARIPRQFRTTWTARAAGYPTGIVLDEDGTVTVGEEGGVVALDTDGRMRWSTLVDGWPVHTAPVTVGDLVAVPGTALVTGLDRATGSARWSLPIANAAAAASETGESLLVASADGVALVDAASGGARWRTTIPPPAPSPAPYVHASDDTGLVVWGTPGDCCHLLALDLADGTTRWGKRLSDASTIPVVYDDAVFVAESAGEDAESARAQRFDLHTGRLEWSTPVDGVYTPTLGAHAAGKDIVFVDSEGALTLLDATTGRVRWQSDPIYAQEEATPVLAGDRVFLIAYDTIFVGLDRRTGHVLGKAPPDPPVFVLQLAALRNRLQMLVMSNGLGAVWNLEQAS
jgi:outer membrane protein assembly factor BamB